MPIGCGRHGADRAPTGAAQPSTGPGVPRGPPNPDLLVPGRPPRRHAPGCADAGHTPEPAAPGPAGRPRADLARSIAPPAGPQDRASGISGRRCVLAAPALPAARGPCAHARLPPHPLPAPGAHARHAAAVPPAAAVRGAFRGPPARPAFLNVRKMSGRSTWLPGSSAGAAGPRGPLSGHPRVLRAGPGPLARGGKGRTADVDGPGARTDTAHLGGRCAFTLDGLDPRVLLWK